MLKYDRILRDDLNGSLQFHQSLFIFSSLVIEPSEAVNEVAVVLLDFQSPPDELFGLIQLLSLFGQTVPEVV